MTMTSYSLGMSGQGRSEYPKSLHVLSLERREGHERGRSSGHRRHLRARGGGGRIGIETVYTRAKLSVFVAQLPVRLSQAFETLGETSRFEECADCDENGCAGDKPMEGQQNSYLIERLATVSTA